VNVNRTAPLAARRVLRRVLAPIVRARTGLEVHHAHRLPTHREPLLIACNHAAFADTVLLSVAIKPRFVVCGAHPRLFATRSKRALMALGNVMRVDDHAQYMADCKALLAAGEILLVYPEMTRNPGGMGRFETWAAEVALAAGTPILPIFLHGTTLGHAHPARVYVGQRLDPTGTAVSLTESLHQAVQALQP
jgi:1-acyl-sn-glycerol-3-phosphate acyltransferase